MFHRTLYHWLISAFLVLFISLQAFSLAHAAEHGGDNHSHDGVACSVTVMAEDQDLCLPVPASYLPAKVGLDPITDIPFITAPLYKAHSRAPPPRAPPTSI